MLVSVLALTLAGSALIAPRSDGAGEPAARLVIKAAEVHVGNGDVFKPGALVLVDGKVAAVGKTVAEDGATVVDVGAGVITPGLVDAACQLGTTRLSAWSEQSSEVIPHLSISDAVDYYSTGFERLVQGGVTTVYISAEAASVIGGQGVAVKTAGPVAGRKLDPAPVIKANIGPESSRRGSFNTTPRGNALSFLTRRPTTRMGGSWVFRKAFYDAIAYKERGTTEADPQAMQALGEVLDGKVGLRMQARMAHDIYTADRLSSEFGLPITIEYAIEAHKCVDFLAQRKIPVIYGPIATSPRGMTASSGDAGRPCLTTAAKLQEGGVQFALTACDLTDENGLGRQAGLAMRFGLEPAAALAAVTSTPAGMLGLGERVGTLQPGRDADLVVWSGAPFADTSGVQSVVVGATVVHDPAGHFEQ